MKKVISLLVGFLMLAPIMGCTKKSANTEQTLEVYCFEAGYGYQWCEDMLELFQKQDWVKEKYPQLVVLPLIHNDVSTFAEGRISAGAKSNTIDLFFGTLNAAQAGKDRNGNDRLADLTEAVYHSPVPGEDGILWKDKALSSYNESNRYIDVANIDADPQYYFTSWAGGMDGIIYNEDILAQLGIDVPNTTRELSEACAQIKALEGNTAGKYNKGYSFMLSGDTDYWKFLFPIFWAQYEGVDRYLDFWNGIADNRLSKKIFEQQGRVKALEVYEDLLRYDKGYLDHSFPTYQFKPAQKMYLQGNGVFHVNGDWFDNEMAADKEEVKNEDGVDYTFKMMKTPVISSIVETLEDKRMDDETLSNVISAIDAGQASYPGVSQPDFDHIKQARTVVYSIGAAHTSAIPSYAVGKDVAIDFLRFMATDVANESYIRSTNGASLPFDYNVKEKNPDLYEGLSPFQKARYDYFYSDAYDIYVLPSVGNAFPLARFGGLKPFVNEDYFATFQASGNKVTPKNFYDDTLGYWTQSRWMDALSRAGMSA